jgi:hypothetical protein
MIKAILLIFEPVATWEGIARTRRSVGFILVVYLLPLLVITSAGEGYGLVRWGRERGKVSELQHLHTFPRKEALIFEAAQFALSLIVVFAAAKMVKSVGETFHGRHTYSQSFTAVAYGLGPLFLMRLMDVFPAVNPWISWAIGIILSIAVLYQGLPRMMEPDPSHALGLFFMTALILILLTGLVRFLTFWYLVGYFAPVETLVAKIAARLPFW